MKSGKRAKAFMSLLSIVVVFTLAAGCTGGGSKKQSGATASPGNTSAPSASASGQQTVTLSFLAHSNYEAALTKVVENFQKENPNIKVKPEFAPFSQLMESIEIKMGSGSSDTDLLFVDSPLVVNYAVKGYLEPLDKLLAADAKSRWVQSAADTVTYKGQLMAAPMNNSSQVLFYNKAILQSKGIPLPKQDERLTWEQIVEMAKKLTFNDGKQQVYGFSFDRVDTSFQFLPLAQSLGATMVREDGLATDGYTNSPAAIQAFQFYYDLFNTWKVSPKIKQDESLDYFISGKVALFAGLSHNLPKLVESGIDFGVTRFPYFDGKKIATPTGSWNVGISKFSKNKEAAAKFLTYLTLGKGTETMLEQGIFPVSADLVNKIMNDPSYSQFPNVTTRIAAEESRTTAAPRPKTPGYLEWDTNVSKALVEIKNGADPKNTLNATVKVIDNLLKKYQGL